MKLIIPMAGVGKRMRPHTLSVPKPLIPIAGQPIVEHQVNDIKRMCGDSIDEIAFVIGDFGVEVEKQLLEIASKQGAKGSIFYQKEPLGTAHAILCAEHALEGKVIVAFADTLFRADLEIDSEQDGIIYVHKVKDPSGFGVVKVNGEGHIEEFVEKPDEFVSDLAIIGIYYFKDGAYLRSELQSLIDNDIKDKGEYQLTSALEHMKQKGSRFITGEISEWLDCGNKDATVYTNRRILELHENGNLISSSVKMENTEIIEPCYIGDNVELTNSVVGPHVSIGEGSKLEKTVVSNSIIQKNSEIKNCLMENSIIGNYVKIWRFQFNEDRKEELNVGDYSQEK